MDPYRILGEYLKLSDIMYQALKAKKYNIFESVLESRGMLVASIVNMEQLFESLNQAEKKDFKDKIKIADEKIEDAMNLYRKFLEHELTKVHISKAKLKKQSRVRNYHYNDIGNQGNFINKLK